MIYTGEQLKQIVSNFLDGDTYVVFWYDKQDAENYIQSESQDENESVDSSEWEAVADELNYYGEREVDNVFANAMNNHVKRDY